MGLIKQKNSIYMCLKRTIKTLLKEEGQDLVEYALLVALIAFGATAAIQGVGSKVSTSFTNIGSKVSSSVN